MRAHYPYVRVRTETVARADSRLAYGFVAGPGVYETTLTRPDLFGDYFLEQFSLLIANHGVPIEIGLSSEPIPVHFSLADHDHLEGSLIARAAAAHARPVRSARPRRDGRRHRQRHLRAERRRRRRAALPLALFTAPRVDYSLHRLRHYTGTAPEHFQNFILFTNYQFYIDEFVRMGRALMDEPAAAGTDGYVRFVEPGRPTTARRRRACRRCRPTTWCGRTAAASR